MSTSSRLEFITALSRRHNARTEAVLPLLLVVMILSIPSMCTHAATALNRAARRRGLFSNLPDTGSLPDADVVRAVCGHIIHTVRCKAENTFVSNIPLAAARLSKEVAKQVGKLIHRIEYTAIFLELDHAGGLRTRSAQRDLAEYADFLLCRSCANPCLCSLWMH